MMQPQLKNQKYSIQRTSRLVNKHIHVPGGGTPQLHGDRSFCLWGFLLDLALCTFSFSCGGSHISFIISFIA